MYTQSPKFLYELTRPKHILNDEKTHAYLSFLVASCFANNQSMNNSLLAFFVLCILDLHNSSVLNVKDEQSIHISMLYEVHGSTKVKRVSSSKSHYI